jgi:cell wall-associated NlpC family hydrolase
MAKTAAEARSTELDPRIHAYRPDLAAESLRGQVAAARFTAGRPAQVLRGVADLRTMPRTDAPLGSQLLCGEAVTVYDETDGWAWVQNGADGYVGYVAADALSGDIHQPTHRLTALRSFRFPEPDIKAPPLDTFTLAGQVAVVGERDRFSELANGGWVFSSHLSALEDRHPDHVATALRFMGTPYLWGGKDSLGLDCSGLIQVVLALAGIPAPRDSDMQAGSLGEPLTEGAPLQRGDLVFLTGHVAIALNDTNVVHANAWHLQVTTEPLTDLVARVQAEYGRGIDVVRRLPG